MCPLSDRSPSASRGFQELQQQLQQLLQLDLEGDLLGSWDVDQIFDRIWVLSTCFL